MPNLSRRVYDIGCRPLVAGYNLLSLFIRFARYSSDGRLVGRLLGPLMWFGQGDNKSPAYFLSVVASALKFSLIIRCARCDQSETRSTHCCCCCCYYCCCKCCCCNCCRFKCCCCYCCCCQCCCCYSCCCCCCC